jgi:hypothetical protein
MIDCICVVQEGQAPDLFKGEIEGVLNRFTTASFGQEARIAWVPVATGNGFTAGRPSTSSVVSITSNKHLSPQRRESLLRELAALWTDTTGCTVDEIVAVISDPVQH